MKDIEVPQLQPRFGGATFALSDRLLRLAWTMVWTLFGAWTPPPLHRWRRWLLVAFGARIDATARVYGRTRIWWPANLIMEAQASIAPGVNCYNVAPITIGAFTSVSQGAHLCTGTHDIDVAAFPLVARPIRIGAQAWVAAEAFVGPGVTIGDGAVLGARGVAFRDLAPWTVYAGNPARPIRLRERSLPEDAGASSVRPA
ncbi:MAG TPA: hypothetical protein VK597_07510 [Inquilinus sp.]|nr:hypothetical protein [Inquilinus sp.]